MNKTIASYIAVGVVVGALFGIPSALVFQPTKTVTKTNTVHTVIKNGQTQTEMIAALGTPAGVTSSPTQVTLPAGCAEFVGKKGADGQPMWIVVACAGLSH